MHRNYQLQIDAFVLSGNNWKHLTECKKAQVHLKMLATKYVYK